MKEIHVYLYKVDKPQLTVSYFGTLGALSRGENIFTTQIRFISAEVFDLRYRLFVHFSDDDWTEIKLGENERTTRIIRSGMDLEKLVLAGEFDKNES